MSDLGITCERERNILSIAAQLVNATIELDEAIIDSQFLFRFDPTWHRSITQIREMIWSLMGEQKSEPLSKQNTLHLRWIMHIERHFGITVGDGDTQGFVIWNKVNNRRGYALFGEEGRDKSLTQFWKMVDNSDFREEIFAKMWMEANQIGKIHGEITRLGRAYGLIPLDGDEDYSKRQKKDFRQRVFDWIVWGNVAPTFRWPVTQLTESRLEGIVRIFRPIGELPMGQWKTLDAGGAVWEENKVENKKPMSKPVRIRTWSIYYLTRRGGGTRTEEQASSLWNQRFSMLNVSAKNFRRDRKWLRKKLFEEGSKKNASNDRLYMGLSSWKESC